MKYVMIMIAVLSAIMPMQASDSKRTFALCVGASCVAGLVSGYLGAKIALRPTQAQKELAGCQAKIREEQSSAVVTLQAEVGRLKASLQAREEQARTDQKAIRARVDNAESRFASLAQSTVDLANQVRLIAAGLEEVKGLHHEIDSKVGAVRRRFVVAAPRSPTAGYPAELGSSDEEGVPLADLGRCAK